MNVKIKTMILFARHDSCNSYSYNNIMSKACITSTLEVLLLPHTELGESLETSYSMQLYLYCLNAHFSWCFEVASQVVKEHGFLC